MTDSPSTPPSTEDPALPVGQRLLLHNNRLMGVAAAAMIVALALWLAFTPGGLLGKADAVGYAVCHRIEARSFFFPDGRQLPMCARCSGTFIGVLVGVLTPGLILRRRRAGLFPPLGMMLLMLGLSAWWAVDGANSFARLLPYDLPRLYEPTNFLRLTTGMLHGITMGSLFLPIFNASLWADVRAERTLDRVWQLLLLYVAGAALIAMVWSRWAIFLYPLALVSALGATTVLVMVNTVIVATILGQENSAHSWREALPLIFLGVVVTVAMIGAIDAVRFAMFGTWGGFVFPTA